MTKWIVEFNSSGIITRCERAFGETVDEHHGFIVEARSKTGAGERARELYMARQRSLLKKRREVYKEQGRCRCGRDYTAEDKVSGFARCKVCRVTDRATNTRHRERVAQGPSALRPKDKPKSVRSAFGLSLVGQAIATTRRSTQTMARLKALLDVQEWWAAAKDEAAFGARVASEIKLLQGELGEEPKAEAAE